MADSLARAFAIAALAGTVAGIAYTAFAIARVRAFRKRDCSTEPQTLPPITVLKPLHGDEPDLYENLRSFCDQDYPEFQIVFGTSDESDAALAVAERLAREFADRDIRINRGCEIQAENPKVANLMGMWPHAKHGLLVIADSDIRVGREYLRALAASFDDAQAGAVTCLYGGTPNDTLASSLGAMFVNDQFAPSVLVALALEPITYCFGATMAVRRDTLERIGGLQALSERLGDDYLLGKLVTENGMRVALCPHIVHTSVTDDSLGALWLHELRWARTILSQRPLGYAGSVVTYLLPFAVAFAVLARTPFSFAALAVAAGLRLWLHVEAGRTFAPEGHLEPWLIPLRDALGLSIWAASFFGRRVTWRRGEYRLSAGGRMAVGPKEM